MAISAFFYDSKTNEFLHGLEWTNSNKKFTNYHYRIIKMTMEDCLNYSQNFRCEISVDKQPVMILECQTFWDVITMVLRNIKTNSVLRKEYFANEWIVKPSLLYKMKAGEI